MTVSFDPVHDDFERFDDAMGSVYDTEYDDPVEGMIHTVDALKNLFASKRMKTIRECSVCIPGMGDYDCYVEDERFWDRFPGGPEKELLEALVNSPHTDQMTSLQTRNFFFGNNIQLLAESTLLARLKQLQFWHSGLNDAGVTILAQAPHLASIEKLMVAEDLARDDGMGHLIASPYIQRLRCLDLSGNTLTETTAGNLAESPYLTELRILRLNRLHSDLGDRGLELLAGSSRLSSLSNLELEYAEVGLAGIRKLCECSGLPNLQWINLGGNPLGDEGLTRLSESPRLAELTVLHVWHAGITAAGVRALARSPHVASLRFLDLRINDLGDDGVKRLAESQFLKGLRSLHLAGNNFGHEGCQALARSNLPSLESLRVSGNTIGDVGLQALVSASWFNQLRDLQLGSAALTDRGARTLIQMRLPNLTNLAIGYNEGITDRQKLIARFGTAVCF